MVPRLPRLMPSLALIPLTVHTIQLVPFGPQLCFPLRRERQTPAVIPDRCSLRLLLVNEELVSRFSLLELLTRSCLRQVGKRSFWLVVQRKGAMHLCHAIRCTNCMRPDLLDIALRRKSCKRRIGLVDQVDVCVGAPCPRR